MRKQDRYLKKRIKKTKTYFQKISIILKIEIRKLGEKIYMGIVEMMGNWRVLGKLLGIFGD